MGLLKSFFTNCANPQGRMGRAMLRFMNLCHAPLTNWGLDLINIKDGWTMLDVGCGGGATLKRLLKRSRGCQVYGIDIQNIPEGAIISMPMCAAGNSRWRSFLIGSLSGAVEPVGAIIVLMLTSTVLPVLPYLLAFAAGAMFYVVIEELIPEASSGQHSNISTIGFAVGFVLMMVLDVIMG